MASSDKCQFFKNVLTASSYFWACLRQEGKKLFYRIKEVFRRVSQMFSNFQLKRPGRPSSIPEYRSRKYYRRSIVFRNRLCGICMELWNIRWRGFRQIEFTCLRLFRSTELWSHFRILCGPFEGTWIGCQILRRTRGGRHSSRCHLPMQAQVARP